MEIVAYQKNIRTSARKLRLVADAVRMKHPTKALVELQFMPKRAARVLYKVMKQAVSNAVNNRQMNETALKTKHILIEEGPTYKRFNAAARGRARQILKRTCHIKVVLEDKVMVSAEPKASKAVKEKEEVKTVENKETKKTKTEVKSEKTKTKKTK